ncbi:MAG: ribosomal subunit interface protein [SAR86 cluster bacterium]|uniref:Ribosomal subunit interface protein n=1 Tax=SAR86 cluster bacterium TaxID=2030880 RepID=A0A2A5B247_9GAMM|nr:MAG: ribosomal subunit interface protein [SAR86 cluster bacterium]
MTNEIQVVFHNIDQTDALTEAVQKRIQKLSRFCDQIINGRVVLDSPHNNHHKGRVYSVSLEIHTPNLEVRVNQDQHDNHAHEDLYVAIRDAFNVAERQLRSVDKKHRADPSQMGAEMAEQDEEFDDEAAA